MGELSLELADELAKLDFVTMGAVPAVANGGDSSSSSAFAFRFRDLLLPQVVMLRRVSLRLLVRTKAHCRLSTSLREKAEEHLLQT